MQERNVARVLIDIIDGRTSPSEPVFVPGQLLERESVLSIDPLQ
jgi:DNA-binding LacI/PurR family transcriptional regulator